MSTFKTRAEMTTALEFIQVLEELRSGSLLGPDGINRALERLAENLDALFSLGQTAANTRLTGGGSFTFPGSASFNWSSAMQVRWPDPKGSVSYNLITTGSGVGARTMVDDGGVAYVVLDRSTEGATVALNYAASVAALFALMAASTSRADYFVIAYRDGNICVLCDGRRIRAGETLSSNGSVDSQYAQQTAFAAVQTRLPQNFNVILSGGGFVSWDGGAGDLTWSSEINVLIPGKQSGNEIAADTETIPVGSVLWATLDRSTGAGGAEAGSAIGGTLTVSTYTAYAALQTNDTIVLAYHHSDGRVYLWNGQSLGDGDVAALGGSISGVQWSYRDYGPNPGEQVTDFTVGGAYPTRTYPIGTGALMLFRNGIKQKASRARWVGGTYPGSGALDIGGGSINETDDYLEEDDGTGTGTRVIWIRDIDSTDPAFHGASEGAKHTYRYISVSAGGVADGSAHDPPHTWPGSSDWIEAFIGIQGQGPSPVESVGIHNDLDPPIDGDVELEAGTGISLTYVSDGPGLPRRILVSVGTGAGVAQLNALSGALQLLAGTGISVTDNGLDEITIDIDAVLSDLTAVTDEMQDAFLGAFLPTRATPYITSLAIEAVQGFDHVWCPDGTNLYCAGGRLNTRGGSSAHLSTAGFPGVARIQANVTDVFPGDTLVINNWLYAYLTHPVTPVVSGVNGATDGGDDRIFTSAGGTFNAISNTAGFPTFTTYLDIAGVGRFLVTRVVSATELRIETGAGAGLVGQSYEVQTVDFSAPEMVLASTPPDRSVAFGMHSGGNLLYAFLTSVWYPTALHPFTKDGDWVTLGEALDATTAFAGAISVRGTWANIVVDPLPATAGGVVRLRLRVPLVDVPGTSGYLFEMLTRVTNGTSSTTHTAVHAPSIVKADGSTETCDFVVYEFDIQLDAARSFDIKLPNDTFTSPSPVAPNTPLAAWILGYSEPRASAAAAAMEP